MAFLGPRLSEPPVVLLIQSVTRTHAQGKSKMQHFLPLMNVIFGLCFRDYGRFSDFACFSNFRPVSHRKKNELPGNLFAGPTR